MSGPLAIRDGRLADLAALEEGPLARVLQALDGRGEETRLVGGAVRDLALGEKPGDFDLATTARPETVMKRARAAGFGVAPTGLAHGTVTVVVEGQPFEVTTLRRDVETDGRRAKVAFGRDFAADALRRDFTINALSLGRDGTVHDYAGGLADLAARRVRFIGDPRQRIREDYLRILRFFRFSARYGEGALDADGFRAAVEEREGLAILSRERVRAELLKLLTAPRASDVVTAVCEAGLLSPLLGSLTDPARFRRLAAIEARRGSAPDALLRLAALCLRVAEDAERLRERLRLSNAEFDRLAILAAALPGLHGFAIPPPFGALRLVLFERRRQGALDALSIAHADSGAAADDRRFAAAYRFLLETPEPSLPITGADVLARGVAGGRRVGAILKSFQALWIRAGFPREPEVLARLLDQAIEG
ncbi:MAG: CCA tRNA nucleotidyltransferase [Hyphomicrobiales bacterium]|nr:CCA tRNA nucleotidyltransferase [Hyphomicrobiales bacterium]MBV8663244.1 CCA tRNA nucleotidyltransferase [Hyphomicrobiales bacterium]